MQLSPIFKTLKRKTGSDLSSLLKSCSRRSLRSWFRAAAAARGLLCPDKRRWHVLSSCGWEACMRACKPRHKEPPARSLMWATAAQPGPRWLSGTQSRGRVFGNQLSWRWQEEERITTVRSGSHRGRDSGELGRLGARERSCGAVVWWWAPPLLWHGTTAAA